MSDYVRCSSCEKTLVQPGRVCFDCCYQTPQEREDAHERLRYRLESKWRRFPLESLGLIIAAGWTGWASFKSRDMIALIGSAVMASIGLRWVRAWVFSLGVLFALTCCGGGEFHAGVDEGGGASAVLSAGAESAHAGTGGSGGTVAAEGGRAGTSGRGGQAGAPSSAAGASGALARGGASGSSSAAAGAGGNSGGAAGISGALNNAGAAGKGECLAGWQGSSCDTCSSAPAMTGESCAEILSCYQANSCGSGCSACEYQKPTTDESVRLARQVYVCRCP